MSEKPLLPGQAQKEKNAFRLAYTAAITIQAPPERVWAIMTNAPDFARWNSTIQRVEGTIAAGQTIRLVAAVAPERVFTLKIIEFVPNKRMVWSDGNALFKGVRTYALDDRPGGGTDFTMAEVYTGLMLPMISGSLPDFAPVFEQYLADLKRAAERA